MKTVVGQLIDLVQVLHITMQKQLLAMLLMLSCGEALMQQCTATGSAGRAGPSVKQMPWTNASTVGFDSNKWLTQHQVVIRIALCSEAQQQSMQWCKGAATLVMKVMQVCQNPRLLALQPWHVVHQRCTS